MNAEPLSNQSSVKNEESRSLNYAQWNSPNIEGVYSQLSNFSKYFFLNNVLKKSSWIMFALNSALAIWIAFAYGNLSMSGGKNLNMEGIIISVFFFFQGILIIAFFYLAIGIYEKSLIKTWDISESILESISEAFHPFSKGNLQPTANENISKNTD